MTGSGARIVLVAEESAGIRAVRLVHGSGHDLVAVLTGDGGTRPVDAGASVAGLAAALGVPTRPASVVRDPATARWLRAERVDVLLNVHSLYVVHPDVVAAPRIGSFNLHPGPLPEYAGLDAPSWAIYHGRARHAVTLHWMASGIDTGPVTFTADIELSPTDTGASASAKCVAEGLPLISELLDRLYDPARIPAVAQDLSRRRYYSRRPPHGGLIPWWASARTVVNLVRACDYSPWPSPWGPARAIRPDGDEIEIVRATSTGRATTQPPGAVGAVAVGGVQVAAADEWVLVRRVRVGGRPVDVPAVLSPGDRLLSPPPGPPSEDLPPAVPASVRPERSL